MDVQYHYTYDILYPQSHSIFKIVTPYIGEMQQTWSPPNGSGPLVAVYRNSNSSRGSNAI